MDRVWDKIASVTNDKTTISIEDIYPSWMDYTYYVICYCNLYEKYLCGGISQADWDRIDQNDKSPIIL